MSLILFCSLRSPPISHHSVWTVISAHNDIISLHSSETTESVSHFYARALAWLAAACISYRNSVLVSICHVPVEFQDQVR